MSSTRAVKCPSCGHVWVPRVPFPVECPKCQVTFKESLRPQPLGSLPNFEAEEHLANLKSALPTPIYPKSDATEEEKARLRAEYQEQVMQYYDADVRSKELGHLKEAYRNAVGIQAKVKKWGMKPTVGSRDEQVDFEWLERKLKGETYTKRLEEDRDEEQDLLDALRLYDPEAERAQVRAKQKEYEHRYGNSPNGDADFERIDDNEKTIKELTPVLTEIIARYDKRIEQLKQSAKEDEPLLPKLEKLDKEGQALKDEILPLLHDYARARMFADESQKKQLMKKLRDRINKHNKLETERNALYAKLQAPDSHKYAGFPSLPDLHRYLDKDVRLLAQEG